MIDIHSHILYNVDDGPETLEETLQLLHQATSEGVNSIISTSHAFNPQYDVTNAIVQTQLAELQAHAKEAGLSIDLHTGHEVRIHEAIVDNVVTGKALTLAGSRYLLLELPSQTVPAYTVPVIEQLLAHEIVPVIAHPERNRAIAEKPERLARLIRRGAVAQVTAGSLAGHFGKAVQQLALQLVEANLVHTYGSDMHNTTTRPMLFNKGLDYLEKKKLVERLEILLDNNERILHNEHLTLLEPLEATSKKWWKPW